MIPPQIRSIASLPIPQGMKENKARDQFDPNSSKEGFKSDFFESRIISEPGEQVS
jgi:hypothetical protein